MSFNINQKFSFLGNLVTMVATGRTPSIVIVGEGGLGKSHTVNSTLADNNLTEEHFITFKGYSTARGLYNTLYDNREKIIVFDDCDSILEDKVAINILKSALDSYDKRTVSWMANMRKNDEYPNQFDFKGGIIFISNKKRESIDDALLTRSLVVDLAMSNSEKIERMRFIAPNMLNEFPNEEKSESLDFLEKMSDTDSISLRTFILVTKIRNQFPENWKDLATFTIK